MKECIKCKTTKSLNRFEFRKDSGKYRNYCKDCNNEYAKNNRVKIQPNISSLYKFCYTCTVEKFIYDFSWKNKSKGKFNYKCKDCVKEEYHKNNLYDKYAETRKQYVLANRDKLNTYNRENYIPKEQ